DQGGLRGLPPLEDEREGPARAAQEGHLRHLRPARRPGPGDAGGGWAVHVVGESRSHLSMKSIKLYKVFVASPGGLQEYRQAVHDTLKEFNDGQVADGDHLYWPQGWLDDVSAGMGRGQGLINPLIKECD